MDYKFIIKKLDEENRRDICNLELGKVFLVKTLLIKNEKLYFINTKNYFHQKTLTE